MPCWGTGELCHHIGTQRNVWWWIRAGVRVWGGLAWVWEHPAAAAAAAARRRCRAAATGIAAVLWYRSAVVSQRDSRM